MVGGQDLDQCVVAVPSRHLERDPTGLAAKRGAAFEQMLEAST